ncbi:MAG: hypothetical protein ACXQTD_07460 [Candidatus Syntropharchaeia archaeon]
MKNAKIYEETLGFVLEIQAMEFQRDGKKPSVADVIGKAVKKYREEMLEAW